MNKYSMSNIEICHGGSANDVKNMDDPRELPDDYTNKLNTIVTNRMREHNKMKECKDMIPRKKVHEYVQYIQSFIDDHIDNKTPINYGTLLDIALKGWKLLDECEQ